MPIELSLIIVSVEEKAARDYRKRDSLPILFSAGQKLENWKLAVYAQAGIEYHLQAIF